MVALGSGTSRRPGLPEDCLDLVREVSRCEAARGEVLEAAADFSTAGQYSWRV